MDIIQHSLLAMILKRISNDVETCLRSLNDDDRLLDPELRTPSPQQPCCSGRGAPLAGQEGTPPVPVGATGPERAPGASASGLDGLGYKDIEYKNSCDGCRRRLPVDLNGMHYRGDHEVVQFCIKQVPCSQGIYCLSSYGPDGVVTERCYFCEQAFCAYCEAVHLSVQEGRK